MTTHNLTRTLTALTLAHLALACAPPTEEPHDHDTDAGDLHEDPQPLVIASAESADLKAELVADAALRVGRNVVYYRVSDRTTGTPVDDCTLQHATTMHMATMSHSSPSVDPGEDGRGEVVFTMPSGDMGTWDITLTATPPGGEPHAFTFTSVPVAASDARRDLVVGEEKFIVTLNFDAAPAVGLNTFVLTVHKKSMHGFMPQTTLTVGVEPEMPTMGHGSSGNVAPVHVANGNYAGTVNLTMPGLWTIDFTLGELGSVQYTLEL